MKLARGGKSVSLSGVACRSYLSIVSVELSIISFDFNRIFRSSNHIFRSYLRNMRHPPRKSHFRSISSSHRILRRVFTDRVTRMAKMKRTRKGGLNLFDKIFPECFVRFKGGEQQRYKAKIQPRNRMDSLSSSLAFSFHEPCHFMTVLFLFTSDSVPSDSK